MAISITMIGCTVKGDNCFDITPSEGSHIHLAWNHIRGENSFHIPSGSKVSVTENYVEDNPSEFLSNINRNKDNKNTTNVYMLKNKLVNVGHAITTDGNLSFTANHSYFSGLDTVVSQTSLAPSQAILMASIQNSLIKNAQSIVATNSSSDDISVDIAHNHISDVDTIYKNKDTDNG